jgi:sulfite reductase beta subunit-like hemoprotein
LGLDCVDTAGAAIRNIVVCPHAGAGKDEPVDVAPFAAWLASHLHGHPDYRSLPRKINIGVSCCRADCARTLIQDVGFQSRMSMNGEYLGFRVVVGGGLGASPRVGQTLMEFVPAAELLLIVDAILGVFNRLGDRQTHGNGRLKFLIESLGLEAFRSEVVLELGRLKNSHPAYPALTPCSEGVSSWEIGTTGPMQDFPLEESKYLRWKNASVVDGSDEMDRMICVPILGGNLNARQLRGIAELVRMHGLHVRLTPEQGVLLGHLWENFTLGVGLPPNGGQFGVLSGGVDMPERIYKLSCTVQGDSIASAGGQSNVRTF